MVRFCTSGKLVASYCGGIQILCLVAPLCLSFRSIHLMFHVGVVTIQIESSTIVHIY